MSVIINEDEFSSGREAAYLNLQFYRIFMEDLHKYMTSGVAVDYLKRFASEKQAILLLKAIKGGD